jgi:hypothetical protein
MQYPPKPKQPVRHSPLSAAALLALPVLALSLPIRAQSASCVTPAAVPHALESADHVPHCSEMAFTHYPPTTGKHFPVWAGFQTFKFALNPGYYVHSQEHGAVVLLVNCRTNGNCEDDFARLQRIADGVPADPLCDAATKHRIIIAADTVMGKRFAAVAWGWSLESDCLDSAAFAAFIAAHYGQGPEQTCARGQDFQGSGWCNGPLGLHAIPPGPAMPSIEVDGDRKGRSRVLWRGNLARRGALRLEAMSLTGATLRRYDLGTAGPGRAEAAWDAHAFKREFPSAHRVVMRLTLETAAGSRRLGESFLTP